MQNIFSKNAFASHMRGGDSRRFGISIKTHRESILEAAVSIAVASSFDFSGFHKTKIKTRNCISLKGYPENLILRSVSTYLSQRHSVITKSRDRIVKEVVETLGDATPMYIIRRDISSFYESLPIKDLRRLLVNDAFIPSRTRKCIEAFFTVLCHGDYGVPRGCGLSAVLAEVAMQKFDQQVRSINGVYKYFRYSDDILIFSFLPFNEVLPFLNDALPTGLSFNPKKLDNIPVCNKDKKNIQKKRFEYLGYQFSFNDYCGDSRPRTIDIAISESKILKLKSKIILSLKAYDKNKDFNILLDRVRFIASNYYAYRRGAILVKNSIYVKSGIYYNYHLCGTYTGEKRDNYGCADLKHLDAFYHHLISSKSSKFASSINKLPPNEIKKLKSISFFKGYVEKMTVKLPTARVRKIKEVWRNA